MMLIRDVLDSSTIYLRKVSSSILLALPSAWNGKIATDTIYN